MRLLWKMPPGNDIFLVNMDEPSKTRVLILDDDEDFLDETKALLEEAGYEAFICEKVVEVLIAIRRYKPDCLILDLKMPVYNGEEFLPWLWSTFPELPVIVCTGVPDVHKHHLFKLGIRHILHKPFSHKVLFKTIAQAIEETPQHSLRKKSA